MKAWRRLLIFSVMMFLPLGCSTGNHSSPGYSPMIERNQELQEETKVETKVETKMEGETILQPSKEVIMDPTLQKELLAKKEEQSEPLTGLFRTSLEAVTEDGAARLNFSFQNISENSLRLTFGSGQKYDIFVMDEQGEEVYRWSHNKAFTMALIMQELKQAESLLFTEAWSMEDNSGEPVPNGVYYVEVRIVVGLSSEEGSTINPDELTAAAVVEVRQ